MRLIQVRSESAQRLWETLDEHKERTIMRLALTPSKIDICGVPVSVVTRAEAVEALDGLLQRPTGCLAVTVAASTLTRASEDPTFKDLLRTADLVFADGWPVVFLSKFQPKALPERVTGVDLTFDYARHANEKARTMVLYGGQPGVAQMAASALSTLYSNGTYVGLTQPSGTFSREFDPGEIATEAERLITMSPCVVFVGIGSPKGDRLAARFAELVPGAAFICVGGAIDNAAGVRRRAPTLLQRLLLEGVFRIIQDPRIKGPTMLRTGTRFPALAVKDLIESVRRRRSPSE